MNNPTPEKQHRWRNDARMLATAFELDLAKLRQDFTQVADKVLCNYAACGADRRSVHFENKNVWALLLDPAFIEKNFPALPAPFSELLALLRIYMGLLDGEAQVERDLGEVRNLLEIHSGPVADETLENVLMIRLSGPVNPGDIATPACGGGLLPTAFTKACAGLWRQLYGARVNCGGRNPKRRGQTANGFSLGVRARVLAAAARVRQTISKYPEEQPTAHGLPAKAFKTAVAPAERSPYWNKKFSAFSKLSKQKAIACSGAQTPIRMMMMPLRSAGVRSQPVAASTVAFLPMTSLGCVDHVRVVIGYHACKSADLIILDTIDRLHQVVPEDETWVIAFLYIVGLGKQVTTLDAWIKLRGDVRSPDANQVVIKHQAGCRHCRKQTVEFLIARDFEGRFPEVVSALRACVNGEDSAWKVVMDFTRKRGKKMEQVRVESLAGLWEWLQMHRRIVNARGKAKVWCDGGLRCA